uniref:glutathione transferase n=1 Tax=Syphacia muris TaxID=451379 RepID=A0A0N5AMW3_9BILA
MPAYKLTYFNVYGLGEGARLLFNYAGVPFEDVRIDHQHWPEIKQRMSMFLWLISDYCIFLEMPFGQVPVLEVDGHIIAQSAAIYRYLGHQFNLAPKCPIEDAMVDAVYDAHKDFAAENKEFFMVAAGFAKGDKDKLMKEVCLPARDKYFGYLKKVLAASDGFHLIGKKLSWADIVIAGNLKSLEGLAPPLFDGFPEIKKFVQQVHELPQLQKYLKERPVLPF